MPPDVHWTICLVLVSMESDFNVFIVQSTTLDLFILLSFNFLSHCQFVSIIIVHHDHVLNCLCLYVYHEVLAQKKNIFIWMSVFSLAIFCLATNS